MTTSGTTGRATIFISYRRVDSAASAGRIYDHLVVRYGRVAIFKDVDSIPPGVNFSDYIEQSIVASDVMLVIIGPRWLNASAGLGRRRLDDPGDFVRIEIETALRLGVAIIPVLVDGAALPPERRLPASLRPLLHHNGLPVRQDPDFTRDLERVYAAIEYWRTQPRRPQAPATAGAPITPKPTTVAPVITPQNASRSGQGSHSASGLNTIVSSTTPQATNALYAAQSYTNRNTRAQEPGTAAATRKARSQRSPRVAPLLTLISALVLAAMTAWLLKSGAVSGLFARASVSGPQATQTEWARATKSGVDATSTAHSVALDTPYTPSGPGPCAPANQRYSHDQPYYWRWSPANSVTCKADGRTARFIPGGELAYYGVPGTPSFPTAFRASVTYTIGAGLIAGCGAIGIGLANQSDDYPTISVCTHQSWSAFRDPNDGSGVQTLPSSIHAPFTIVMTVTATTVAFSVNGQQLLASTSFTGSIDRIVLDQTGEASGSNVDTLYASNFSITPTAS